MFNKDLLMSSGKNLGPYTHIVTVDYALGNNFGYWYIGDGAVTPDTFMGVFLELVYTDPFDDNTLVGCKTPTGVPAGKVWVGRYDKKIQAIESRITGPSDSNYRFDDFVLFTKDDLGKDIPIWISTTPPRGSKPMFFKQLFNLSEGCLDVQQGFTFHQRRINCRCHRYCRYLSRWGNRIRQIVRTSFTGGNQSHQTSDWRRNYGFVSGLCNIGRIIYNGSIRQYLFQRYETFSHRVPDGRNVSTLWRFVLSLCASHTMGGAYA